MQTFITICIIIGASLYVVRHIVCGLRHNDCDKCQLSKTCRKKKKQK